MKIALVGGIGYMGGRLAAHLRSKRYHVRLTTRRSLKDVPRWVESDQVVHDDLKNVNILRKHLADRDVVIYLASPDEKEAERNPIAAIRAGSESVWNVLEAISSMPQKSRFIFLSTFHVYGQAGKGTVTERTLPLPVHPYGLGRYIGENIVQVFRRQHGMKALCVRMSNVVGSPADFSVPRWTLLLGDLCLQVVTQKKMVLRSPPTTQRNFIPMENAVRALEFLARPMAPWPADGVIHLGSPRSLTLDQLAQRVARCAAREIGNTPTILYLSKTRIDDSARFPLRYSVRRLQHMGFSWNNSMDREITTTLKMCREAYAKWGPKIYRVGGLQAQKPSACA